MWWLPLIGLLTAVAYSLSPLPLALVLLATPLEVTVGGVLWAQELLARRRGEAGPRGRALVAWSAAMLALHLALTVVFVVWLSHPTMLDH